MYKICKSRFFYLLYGEINLLSSAYNAAKKKLKHVTFAKHDHHIIIALKPNLHYKLKKLGSLFFARTAKNTIIENLKVNNDMTFLSNLLQKRNCNKNLICLLRATLNPFI